MIEPRLRDCAPIGAKECYGFPVGYNHHWYYTDEEKAERERRYHEEYCTDKPTKRYYLEKYAQIFMIFYQAAELGIYKCSDSEWAYLWSRQEYYREQAEQIALQGTDKDYIPNYHQRQDTQEMWKRLYELKRELTH